MGISFMVGMIIAFMFWCSIGLIVLFAINEETDTSAETILYSLFFPLIFINFMLEYINSKFEKRANKAP